MAKHSSECSKEHEWVETGFCIGFNTKHGCIIDLDNVTYRKAKWMARTLCRQYRLEGYLIVLTSPKNYHLIFNRILKWKTITKILFNQYEVLRWAVFQMQKGYLALRVSKKNGKNEPKIVFKTGRQDKLIAEYMELYESVKRL